jgi:hypothetical protein
MADERAAGRAKRAWGLGGVQQGRRVVAAVSNRRLGCSTRLTELWTVAGRRPLDR